MKTYQLLFIFFIFVILLCNFNKENYENIYEKNEVLPDEPDDKQFYACRQQVFTEDEDYPFMQYPNSNYRVKQNQVRKPLNGTFSAFMDVNKIRTYDHFYHAPICEDNIVKDKDGNIIENNSFSFDTDIESQFRLIPGAFPEEDISVIYEEEKRKDSHDLRNPYYFYGNPKFIENTILYENDIKEMFLKIKSERPLHHEDDSHLVGFESQYGNNP